MVIFKAGKLKNSSGRVNVLEGPRYFQEDTELAQ